jgi:propionyl-CoA carboxylase alpha chain
MNTRLQVEHPVTELVTGLDLVELMIRIAAGEKLPLKQKDVKLEGWAIEARIYAEDPFRNFLPSIGRLVRYVPPQGPDIRVDTGVYEGAEISMFYDPMIAKLVTSGPSREAATERMREALDAFHIRGVSHNVPFLAALLAKKRFVEGRLSTNFIAEEFPGGFSGADLPAADLSQLVAVAAVAQLRRAARDGAISGQLPGHGAKLGERWVVCLPETRHEVSVTATDGAYLVEGEAARHEVATDWQPGMALLRAVIDGRPTVWQVDRDGIGFRLFRGGASTLVRVLPPVAAKLFALMPVKQPPDLSRFLLSPMPGLLVRIAVAEGQEVKAGEELAVIEAMKMENVLRAERDARVGAVKASPGDSLAVDQVILEFQ